MFGYCGNLGHPTDPENGLIYMRARFYEPWTGRFLNEDPEHDLDNWYIYCYNAPTSRVDFDGRAFTGVNFFSLFLASLIISFEQALVANSAWATIEFVREGKRLQIEFSSQASAKMLELDAEMKLWYETARRASEPNMQHLAFQMAESAKGQKTVVGIQRSLIHSVANAMIPLMASYLELNQLGL